MTITEINRQSIKVVHEFAEEALKTVAQRLGLDLQAKGGSFDPAGGTYTPKFVFSLPGSEDMSFARDCEYVYTIVDGRPESLQPTDLGAWFEYGLTKYKLVGLNPKAPKYPIIGENEHGKRFKFGRNVVQKIIENRSPDASSYTPEDELS